MDEQVTLSGYADQVRELIRHDRNDEAIAICKHILRHYPKYIDAYRQMGEALLEKRDFDGAKDVFRRVLSADPENAIAYVGLSAVFEQDQVIGEAVWYMERAFELAPGNAELQNELVRLYNEFDIKPHTRAKLTAGALARIYAQEGLFGQAIQEFRVIISSAPARFDLRVALAETLWRMGRMSEAAQVAQNILDHLPYCLKANLILGAAWKETGLSESDVYLQRAQALDPMNQISTRLLGARSPLPAVRASLPRFVEGVPEPISPEPLPSESPATRAEGMFAELSDTRDMPETDLTALPVETSANLPEENLPVWLRRPAQARDTQLESGDQATSDWLSKLRTMPAEENAPDAPATMPTIDWLNAFKTDAVAQPASPDQAAPLPTWLGDGAPAESAPDLPGTESGPAQPAADWLGGMETAAPAESVPFESKPAEDWLRGLEETAAPSKPASAPTASAELPTWLAQSPAETLPAWLVRPAPASAPTEEPPPPALFDDLRVPIAAERMTLPDDSPVFVEPAAPVFEPPAPVRAETVVPETLVVPAEPKRKRAPKGYAHLVQARAHRDAHRWNDVLTEYDYLVQHAPRLVREVIDDLEILMEQSDFPLEAHRILGDAYTRADRLADALERYRFVLEHVS